MNTKSLLLKGIYAGLGCFLLQIIPWLWSLKVFLKSFLLGEQPEFFLFILIILILIFLGVLSTMMGYFIAKNLAINIIASLIVIILLHLTGAIMIINTLFISN
jgi:hypothetical protein